MKDPYTSVRKDKYPNRKEKSDCNVATPKTSVGPMENSETGLILQNCFKLRLDSGFP